MNVFQSNLAHLKICFYVIGVTSLMSCVDRELSHEERANQIIAAIGDRNGGPAQVINHFQTINRDSAKLEAAYYLVGNLDYHQYKTGHEKYSLAFDRLYDINNRDIPLWKKRNLRESIWNSTIDSISNLSRKKGEGQLDVMTITSDFLIENIDQAFSAVEKLPETFRPSRKMFLHYVLPYRVSQEPIEGMDRKQLRQKYNWVIEEAKRQGSLNAAICTLYDSLSLRIRHLRYPLGLMPIRQVERVQTVSCDNLVNLMVHILRSVGIPATSDHLLHWGNHYYSGHSWLVFFENGQAVPIDVQNNKLVKELYEVAAIPKIYRRTFHTISQTKNFWKQKDVTSFYKKKNRAKIDLTHNGSVVELFVLSTHGKWEPVGYTPPSSGEVVFENIGSGIVYAAKLNNSTDEYHTFYLNDSSSVTEFKANHGQRVTAKLTRKYQPYEYRNLSKMQWAKNIAGAQILGSNDISHDSATVLVTVPDDFHTTKVYQVDHQDKFQYYSLFLPNPTVGRFGEVASFDILDEQRQRVSPKDRVFAWKNPLDSTRYQYNVFDHDPLTFFKNYKWMRLSYYFEEAVTIRDFMIQTRNDDNHIRLGDEYEMMYWDGQWQSLGRQIANSYTLEYQNVPTGTFYWLRNHTRGREEQVFLLDENGNQVWPGIPDVEHPETYEHLIELDDLCKS